MSADARLKNLKAWAHWKILELNRAAEKAGVNRDDDNFPDDVLWVCQEVERLKAQVEAGEKLNEVVLSMPVHNLNNSELTKRQKAIESWYKASRGEVDSHD